MQPTSLRRIKMKKSSSTSSALMILYYEFGRNGIGMAKLGNFVLSRKSIRTEKREREREIEPRGSAA